VNRCRGAGNSAKATLAVAALLFCGCGPAELPRGSADAGRPARISPDYPGIVLPPNIAPLNFMINEPGIRYFAAARTVDGAREIRVRSGAPADRVQQQAR